MFCVTTQLAQSHRAQRRRLCMTSEIAAWINWRKRSGDGRPAATPEYAEVRLVVVATPVRAMGRPMNMTTSPTPRMTPPPEAPVAVKTAPTTINTKPKKRRRMPQIEARQPFDLRIASRSGCSFTTAKNVSTTAQAGYDAPIAPTGADG